MTPEVMDPMPAMRHLAVMPLSKAQVGLIESPSNDAPDGFGLALRRWREVRRMSQLELALEAQSSARHVSCLETGRARPSREMALRLADVLGLPRAARNALLVSAGFAPVFPASPLTSAELEPLRAILLEMMRRHAPWPALLCDAHWNVLDANAPTQRLLAPMLAATGESNLIRMIASPAAADFVVNLAEVIAELRERLRTELMLAGDDPTLTELLETLPAASGREPATRSPRRAIAPFVMHVEGRDLAFLTTIAHFGTSEDITVRDLRLELLFPADGPTREALLEAAETPSPM